MKFNIFIHFLLLCLVIGFATGAEKENVRPIIEYGLNGLSAGLGISFIIRLFLGIW